MFCSTVIPTVGRSSLTRAVCSVLDQRFSADGFEIIVVNDSGSPLSETPWRSSPRVTLIDTNRRERSVARNAGAAIARGTYLHFLDDDDVMLPDALQAFWDLHQATDAIWLFGNYQSMDNEGKLVDEFDPQVDGDILSLLVAGESIPFQASLLRSEHFFAVGAFDPGITGPEDRDLGRRLALVGRVKGTSAVVARIRVGERGSTTDWSTLAERDRWGREKALRQLGAYRRLWSSAQGSYLRGRLTRACIASMVWNARHESPLIAGSRALAGIAFAGPHVMRPGFWRGLRTRVS